MKKVILGTTIITGLLFSTNYVNASGEEQLNVKPSVSENSASLQWSDIGDTYQVFQNGKLSWEGKNTSFSVNNLEKNTPIDFRVVAKKNNKVEDVSQVKVITNNAETNNLNLRGNFTVSNKSIESIKEIVKEEANIASVVDKDSVKITWSNLPDEDGVYEIYRDNEKISETRNMTFTDHSAKPETIYNYTVQAVNKLNEEDYEQRLQEAEKNGFNLSSQDKEAMKYHSAKLSRVVKTLHEDDALNAIKDTKVLEIPTNSGTATRAATTNQYMLRYQTFIPLAKAPNPFGILTGTYFKGDDRGFSSSSNKYRTRADHLVKFSSGSASLTPAYSVGRTVLYNANGTVKSDRVASSSGMKITSKSVNSTRIVYSFSHDVGIPYADAMSPDISYTNNVTIFPSGTVTVTGNYDGAPSHEMYIYIPNSDVSATILQAKHQDFLSLAPPMEHSFKVSL